MSDRVEDLLPGILAILIDRSLGMITLTEREVERLGEMNPEIQFSTVDDFSGDALRIRYRDRTTIEGETV